MGSTASKLLRQQAYLDALALGASSRNQAAKASGVPLATVNSWTYGDREFAEREARARARGAGEAVLVEHGRDALAAMRELDVASQGVVDDLEAEIAAARARLR